MMPLDRIMLSTHSDGKLQFFDSENARILASCSTNTAITAAATSPTSMLFAIGSEHGTVRIYNADPILQANPRLLFRAKTHDSKVTKVFIIKKLEFEHNGKYLVSGAQDGKVYIYSVMNNFKVIGYINVPGRFNSLHWEISDLDVTLKLKLFILCEHQTDNNSVILSYSMPLDGTIKVSDETPFKIDRKALDVY